MPRTTRPSESAEGVCPVCSETINIYAIGMCDHPVCYSCSTRMRVLSEQMQCAICRVEIPKVIFIQHPGKYEETDTYNFQVFRKFKIYFENETVQQSFYELLDHACQLCKERKTFRTFILLRDHMRKEHSQFYCDLCVSHLKVFSHQRKFYDRTKLGLHRRVGDEDDKSHRGHPLCEFCDERFLDNDELVRHLRTEHYFCHLCDADGITNQFYCEYSFLREHFKAMHYLCEEGECLHTEFTNVFRSDIDMKAHFATEHVNKMRKSQVRQARTLEFGFSLTPRPGHGAGGRRDRDRGNRDRDRDYERDRGGRAQWKGGPDNGGAVISADDYEEVQIENQSRKGHGGKGRSYGSNQRYADLREAEETARAISESLATGMPVPQNEDFPLLDGRVVADSGPDHDVSKHNPAHVIPENMANYVARNNNFSVSDGRMEEEDFPSLGSKLKNAPAGDGNAAWPFKPNKKDFPVLGNSQKPKDSQPPKTTSASTSWHSQTPQVQAPTRALSEGPAKRYSQPAMKLTVIPPKSLSSIGSALRGASKPTSNGNANKRMKSFTDSEDFPALGASKPVNQPVGISFDTKSSSKSRTTEPSKVIKTVEAMFDEEFPSLGGPPVSIPAPTSAPLSARTPAPATDKELDILQTIAIHTIALKKLQNQQKHIEDDSFEVPAKEPVSEKPKKTQSKQTQEKVPESSVKKEDKASKLNPKDSHKSDQRKKNVEGKMKKSHQDDTDEEQWQMQSKLKCNEKKSLSQDKTETPDDHLPEDHWDVSQVEKNQEKKKKKKVEKFEDEYPSLGGGSSMVVRTGVTAWGKIGKTEDTIEPENEPFHVLKAKKKNKKEKDNTNKKTINEPEPTWGYDPNFVEPVILKPKPKEPPGLIYKENKEPKRDKDEPWGHIVDNEDNADFPSMFKVEEFNTGSALKDQSNFTLATLTANMKGFSLNPPTLPVKVPDLIDDLLTSSSGCPKPSPPPGLGFVNPVPKPPPPPPGFDKLAGDTDATITPAAKPAPPPGFSAAPSSGGSLEDKPENNNLPPVEYQKPDCFMDRNTRLITDVQAFLGDSDDMFLQFKKSSGCFRQGKISGCDYYEQCVNIIGPEGFRQIFPELLVLLPDIDKQHELLVAHNAAMQPKRGMTTKKEKAERKAWATTDRIFSTCPVCRQVLVDADVAEHGTEHHMDIDFPTLCSTPGNKYGFSAWVKGN